jgi:hypothetical protein
VTPITGEISPQGASGIGGTQPLERNRLRPRRGEENRQNGPRSGLRSVALRRRCASELAPRNGMPGSVRGVAPHGPAAPGLPLEAPVLALGVTMQACGNWHRTCVELAWPLVKRKISSLCSGGKRSCKLPSLRCPSVTRTGTTSLSLLMEQVRRPGTLVERRCQSRTYTPARQY